MRTKYLVMGAVLGVILVVGVGLLVLSPWQTVMSTEPSPPRCNKPDQVDIYLKTDDAMTQATAKVRAEHQDADVAGQTQQQSYEEFQRLFADQPELLKTTRPESLPAVVKVMPKPGVSASAVADRITKEFPPPAQVERLICSELNH